MPSPKTTTNPETVALILGSMSGWFVRHDEVLVLVVGTDFNGAQKSLLLSAKVREADKSYFGKRRDNVSRTADLKDVLIEVRKYLTANVSLIRFTYPDKRRYKIVLKDFLKYPPSKIRNATKANQALAGGITALERYRADIDRKVSRTDSLIGQANDLITRVEKTVHLKSEDTSESRQAKLDRAEAVEEAIDFIREAKLVAMSLEFTNPEVYLELRSIFDNYLPKRFKTGDKLIEEFEKDLEDSKINEQTPDVTE